MVGTHLLTSAKGTPAWQDCREPDYPEPQCPGKQESVLIHRNILSISVRIRLVVARGLAMNCSRRAVYALTDIRAK